MKPLATEVKELSKAGPSLKSRNDPLRSSTKRYYSIHEATKRENGSGTCPPKVKILSL